MKPEHQNKVDELVALIASNLRIETQRLYHSGGIDPEKYDIDSYALAKVLVTAAMYREKDLYTPFRDEHKKDMENLIHI